MTNHRVPPFTVHFHLEDGTEILNTSDGKWMERDVNYNSDCLCVWCKNLEFLGDPRFVAAYREGMDSGHKLGREAGSNADVHVEWRVHVACWAAQHAAHLAGDFVECGVNTGILSLAVCKYIDFNRTGKTFFLVDTYCGIPREQIGEDERKRGRESENEEFYEECFERARQNFSRYPRARLIRGVVPGVLSTIDVDRVCYLSIDMNIAAPELAALEYFWDKLVPGAPILLDDYGWKAYSAQKEAADGFAAERGVEVLTMPTGQGLILKP